MSQITRRKVQRLSTGMAGSPLSGVKEAPSKSERNAADYQRRKESEEWKAVAKELRHRLSFYSLKEREEILAYLERYNTPEEARKWLAAFKEWGEDRASYGPTGAKVATGDRRSDVPAGYQLEAIDAKNQANQIAEDFDGDKKVFGAGGGRKVTPDGRGPDANHDRDSSRDNGVNEGGWFAPSRNMAEGVNAAAYQADFSLDSKSNPAAARKWCGSREGDCPEEVRARIARGNEEYRVIDLAAKLVEFRKNDARLFFACRICGKQFETGEHFDLPKDGIRVDVKEFGGPARDPDYTLVSDPDCGALLAAMNHVRHDHPIHQTKKDVNHLLSRWVPIRDEVLAKFIPDQMPLRCLFCGEPFLSWNAAVNHFLFGELGHFKGGKVLPHCGEKTTKDEIKRRMNYRADQLLSDLPVDSTNQFGCAWFCCKAPDMTKFRGQVLKNHADKLSDIVWLHFSERIRPKC